MTLLTMPEVARVLRVSEARAYELAREQLLQPFGWVASCALKRRPCSNGYGAAARRCREGGGVHP